MPNASRSKNGPVDRLVIEAPSTSDIEKTLRQALEVYDAKFGPHSKQSLDAALRLANFYLKESNASLAIQVMEYLVASPNVEYANWMGPRMNLLYDLGKLLRNAGSETEALMKLKEAADIASIYTAALGMIGPVPIYEAIIAEFKIALQKSHLASSEKAAVLSSHEQHAQDLFARIGRKEPGSELDANFLAKMMANKSQAKVSDPVAPETASTPVNKRWFSRCLDFLGGKG